MVQRVDVQPSPRESKLAPSRLMIIDSFIAFTRSKASSSDTPTFSPIWAYGAWQTGKPVWIIFKIFLSMSSISMEIHSAYIN